MASSDDEVIIPQSVRKRMSLPESDDDAPIVPPTLASDVVEEDDVLISDLPPTPKKRKLTTRAARMKNAAAAGTGQQAAYGRIERMIEQQLLEDDEKPIWNADDGAEQGLLEDTLPLAEASKPPRATKSQPKKERRAPVKAERKPVTKKALRAPTQRARVPFTQQASKKWRFRELDSEESSDDEPELKLIGNIDDMIRGAENAARKAGEDAPDLLIAQRTREKLDEMLIDHADEMLTAEDLAPKIKKVRVAAGIKRDGTGAVITRARTTRARDELATQKDTNDGDKKWDGEWNKDDNSWYDNSKDQWKSNDWKKDWSAKNGWDTKDSWNKKGSWDKKDSWDNKDSSDNKDDDAGGKNGWQKKNTFTITINASKKQEWLQRRHGGVAPASTFGFRQNTMFYDAIAARRNVAFQKDACALYARMAHMAGVRTF